MMSRMNRSLLALLCSIRHVLSDFKSKIILDKYLIILILLTITGLVLRLWHIGDVSFWLDETLTNDYSHLSFLEIWSTGTDGVNPPTFYWIEHVMLFFGSGEAVLRLFPALAGTATIPVFYLLGREFHNRETGLVAAALLTISSFHIYYSQEARPYTLFLFFFSLALVFYLRACRTNSCSAWILFGVFSALSCWAHLFGIVFVVPLFLLPLLVPFISVKTGIRDLKPVILAGATWFLLSLPMLLAMVWAGLENADAAGTWGYQGIAVITSTCKEAFGQYYMGVIIMGILFLMGLVWILHNDWKRFMFIVVALVIPLGITVVLSSRMAIVPRYLIGLLPFFFLGIAYLIGSLHYRIFTVRFSCIAILLLILLSIPSLNLYYSADSKYGQDWKDLSPVLHNLTGTGDRILIYPAYHTLPLTYYYQNGTDQTVVYGVKNKEDLQEPVEQNTGQKKMLIIVGSDKRDLSGYIDTWIKTHAVLVTRQEQLFLYRVL